MVHLAPELASIFNRNPLVFYLNGIKVELQEPNPQWTLLDFIRSQHGLKGTKLGCGEGGCGACTVVVQTFHRSANSRDRIQHLAVNACLFPLIGGMCRCSHGCEKRQSNQNHSCWKTCDYYRGIGRCRKSSSTPRTDSKTSWLTVRNWLLQCSNIWCS